MQVIKLNKKIYSKQAIEQAVTDWQEFANFKLQDQDNYFNLEILPKDFQENLENEFINYIISLM